MTQHGLNVFPAWPNGLEGWRAQGLKMDPMSQGYPCPKAPKLVSSNRACRILGGHFRRKKGACGKLVSRKRAYQILGDHFHPRKNACCKLLSSNRSCQILGGQFHRNKSAGGKIPSSNRACQILGGRFHREKKAPAASWLATIELVKVQIMAASWISTTAR